MVVLSTVALAQNHNFVWSEDAVAMENVAKKIRTASLVLATCFDAVGANGTLQLNVQLLFRIFRDSGDKKAKSSNMLYCVQQSVVLKIRDSN